MMATLSLSRCCFCYQNLRPQLEPLTDKQVVEVGGLQQTSMQVEDALSQGMDKLKQTIADSLTAADPFDSPEAYMVHMANAVEQLRSLVQFVTQVTKPNQNQPPKTLIASLSHSSWHLGLVCAGRSSPAADAAGDAQDPDDAAGGEGAPRAGGLLPALPSAELAMGSSPARFRDKLNTVIWSR